MRRILLDRLDMLPRVRQTREHRITLEQAHLRIVDQVEDALGAGEPGSTQPPSALPMRNESSSASGPPGVRGSRPEAGRSTVEIDGIVAKTLERAPALREAVLGPDDRAVASVLVDLSDARRAFGETVVARALLERGLETRRETLGPAYPRTLELDQRLQAFAPDP